MKKKQVLVIHGGDFFDTREECFDMIKRWEVTEESLLGKEKKRWKDNLREDLGDGYETMLPAMPLRDFARYEEWAMWFEKVIPFLRDGVILVGHSLGGIFLARYLSENAFPVRIKGLFLLAAPYFKIDRKKGGETNSGFFLKDGLEKLASQAENVFIYHSTDDPVVDVNHAKEYEKRIPGSKLVLFDGLGHLRQEHFKELVRDIKALK